MNRIDKMYNDLKKEFETVAEMTGAQNCIYFNFTLNPKTNCSKKDDFGCRCKVFDGKECTYLGGKHDTIK